MKPSLFSKSSAGFTLVELLVIIFIIGIITSVVIVNFRAGDKRKTLQMGTEEVASLIRTAQSKSLSGESEGGSFPEGGYGVYLGLNQGYAVLFADSDGDQNYDGPKSPPFSGGEQLVNEYVSHVKLRDGLTIDKIFKDKKVLREAEIVFFPPRPTMYFDKDNTITAGRIVFKMEGTNDQKEIFLNCISGQIDVRNLE